MAGQLVPSVTASGAAPSAGVATMQPVVAAPPVDAAPARVSTRAVARGASRVTGSVETEIDRCEDGKGVVRAVQHDSWEDAAARHPHQRQHRAEEGEGQEAEDEPMDE